MNVSFPIIKNVFLCLNQGLGGTDCVGVSWLYWYFSSCTVCVAVQSANQQSICSVCHTKNGGKKSQYLRTIAQDRLQYSYTRYPK